MARWLLILLSAPVMAASFTASSRERQLIARRRLRCRWALSRLNIMRYYYWWESGGKTVRATYVASSHPVTRWVSKGIAPGFLDGGCGRSKSPSTFRNVRRPLSPLSRHCGPIPGLAVSRGPPSAFRPCTSASPRDYPDQRECAKPSGPGRPRGSRRRLATIQRALVNLNGRSAARDGFCPSRADGDWRGLGSGIDIGPQFNP
jgi:hypothetical protein